MHSLSHCATTACDAAADVAFAFLADSSRIGSWALGCWDAQPAGEGIGSGKVALRRLDRVRAGGPRLRPAEHRFRRWCADPDALVQRISARVIPGPALGYGEDRSLVTLLAWRPAEMSDDRWSRLVASHEAEILLLRARIEEAANDAW